METGAEDILVPACSIIPWLKTLCAQRLSLVYNDFETQECIMKDSAWSYKSVIEAYEENP